MCPRDNWTAFQCGKVYSLFFISAFLKGPNLKQMLNCYFGITGSQPEDAETAAGGVFTSGRRLQDQGF